MKPVVYLGMPSRDGTAHMKAHAAFFAATTSGEIGICHGSSTSSLLNFNCNSLWANALNGASFNGGPFTHFAIQHNDVCPEPGWLDVLHRVMQRTKAVVVSAVIPHRSNTGYTSTALETGVFYKPRPLTLKETFSRGETFTDPDLLVNTGLMLVDMSDPNIKHCHFSCKDTVEISHLEDKFVARTIPEDWNFSRMVKIFTKKELYATHLVKLFHDRPEWHNHHPWGQENEQA